MTPFVFVLAALATYRVTLLVTADELTRPYRERLAERVGERTAPAYLLTCPWCCSMWVAGPVIGSALAWGDGWGWLLVAGALAASAVTGALASYALPNT